MKDNGALISVSVVSLSAKEWKTDVEETWCAVCWLGYDHTRSRGELL